MAVFKGIGEQKYYEKGRRAGEELKILGLIRNIISLKKETSTVVTCISRIRRRVARDLESECTMESSNDSSARINICPFRVSNQ